MDFDHGACRLEAVSPHPDKLENSDDASVAVKLLCLLRQKHTLLPHQWQVVLNFLNLRYVLL